MIESESPPVLWGQIALYEHEREVGMWTAGTPSEDT
jgi:hypothetical protein